MADRLTAKSALTGANTAVGDLYYVVDISDTTDNASGSDKKQTAAELFNVWPVAIATEMTGSGAAATDEYLFSDAGVVKTITVVESANALWPGVATEMTGTSAVSTDELLFSDAGVSKTITVLELAAAQIQVSTALVGSGVVPGTDTVCVSDGGVSKKMTFTEFMTALALAGYTLADIPEYADQAAAQAGLSGTGKLFRFTTTGALGITIA